MEALKGIRILDMSHVQAGPTCSSCSPGWAPDVIKFENPQGDATRSQLRDVPNADSLYFTMLNCNKRSITVNMKTAEGKQVFVEIAGEVRHHQEKFRARRARPARLHLGEDPPINPRIVMGSNQGLRFVRRTPTQAYENVAAGDGVP